VAATVTYYKAIKATVTASNGSSAIDTNQCSFLPANHLIFSPLQVRWYRGVFRWLCPSFLMYGFALTTISVEQGRSNGRASRANARHADLQSVPP
jgi:hypothetical protein